MRFFKFIKWWWARSDYFDRAIGSFIALWAIPCALASIWAGPPALLLILFGMLAYLVGAIVFAILYWVRSLWRKFTREVPPDDVKIINRLKGIHTPSEQKEYYD